MNKTDAIKLIDQHKNALVDPVAMLHWTWLRVIVNQIPDHEWEKYLEDAMEVVARWQTRIGLTIY